MCQFLHELERGGVKVYRTAVDTVYTGAARDSPQDQRTVDHDLNDALQRTIKTHMATTRASHYVVTDPDIALFDAPNGDVLYA